jgi:hypothetical protein
MYFQSPTSTLVNSDIYVQLYLRELGCGGGRRSSRLSGYSGAMQEIHVIIAERNHLANGQDNEREDRQKLP